MDLSDPLKLKTNIIISIRSLGIFNYDKKKKKTFSCNVVTYNNLAVVIQTLLCKNKEYNFKNNSLKIIKLVFFHQLNNN